LKPSLFKALVFFKRSKHWLGWYSIVSIKEIADLIPLFLLVLLRLELLLRDMVLLLRDMVLLLRDMALLLRAWRPDLVAMALLLRDMVDLQAATLFHRQAFAPYTILLGCLLNNLEWYRDPEGIRIQ
jgi:hypothetical protein